MWGNILTHIGVHHTIYKMFDCLLRLWMGIWLHTHTITITDVSSDFRELAEILPDAEQNNLGN